MVMFHAPMTTSRARRLLLSLCMWMTCWVGSKKTLKGFFKHLQTVWDIATPEYLTGSPDDVDSIRFLGMEIEKDNETNNWIVHQQPYVMDTLNKFCPSYPTEKNYAW
eukprot:4602163-Amphidinium_carterae.1